jgi:F-type H+-transporting ATPase subunit epsilon
MADTIELQIVTPERLVVKDAVEEVQIPGKNGYMGILPGHAPLISELAVGEIVYKIGGRAHHLACAWGFTEVLPDKVTILAETAERASEIDVPRAEEALRKADEQLKSGDPNTDYQHVIGAQQRAEVRLQVAKEKE